MNNFVDPGFSTCRWPAPSFYFKAASTRFLVVKSGQIHNFSQTFSEDASTRFCLKSDNRKDRFTLYDFRLSDIFSKTILKIFFKVDLRTKFKCFSICSIGITKLINFFLRKLVLVENRIGSCDVFFFFSPGYTTYFCRPLPPTSITFHYSFTL